MKPKRHLATSKKNHGRRERALAISRRPERYGHEEHAWLEQHKHLIEDGSKPKES